MNAKTMCRVGLVGLAVGVLNISVFAADKYTFKPTQIRHGIVIGDTTGKWAYHWPRVMPAQWGSEIVINCTKSEWSGHGNYPGGHERILESQRDWQFRSTDNGETWTDEGDFTNRVTGPVKLPIDFANPNFCARLYKPGVHYISYDRCKTWLGPWEAWVGLGGGCNGVFHLKNEGKTVVTVTDQRHLSKFRHNCRTLLTTDQGRTWSQEGEWKGVFTSFEIDPICGVYPKGLEDYAITIGPYTVRLGEDELLGVGRSRFGGVLHRSMDFGKSWKLDGVVHSYSPGFWIESWLVVLGGQYPHNPNPKNLIAFWGARGPMTGTDSEGKKLGAGPRVRLSKDGGRTWSENVVQLRNDVEDRKGSDFDTGEPVAYERTDGKIIMIYWWQTKANPQPHIAYTVFDPNIEGKK